MISILVPKSWTNQEISKSYEHKGRKKTLGHGSYISDLVALKKAIVLCWKCRRKFNEKTSHYMKHHAIPFVRNSRCDACKQLSMQAELFIHEEMNYLKGD
jgi:hypothetical protein